MRARAKARKDGVNGDDDIVARGQQCRCRRCRCHIVAPPLPCYRACEDEGRARAPKDNDDFVVVALSRHHCRVVGCVRTRASEGDVEGSGSEGEDVRTMARVFIALCVGRG